MKWPSAVAVRTWIGTNLFHVGTILAAVGGLGPYIPKLVGLGVSPQWVFQIGTIVGFAGAAGAAISNPPLWLKLLVPWLYPVTPAMHDASLTRLVAPVIKPSERTTPVDGTYVAGIRRSTNPPDPPAAA